MLGVCGTARQQRLCRVAGILFYSRFVGSASVVALRAARGPRIIRRGLVKRTVTINSV